MTDPQSWLQLSPVGAIHVLDLGWPLSFNSYKNSYNQTSKRGRIWRDVTVDAIRIQCGGRLPEPLLGRVAVYWEMWAPDDKRKRDLDNFTGKHLQDVLQHAHVLADDSQVIEDHRYIRPKWGKGKVIATVMEV